MALIFGKGLSAGHHTSQMEEEETQPEIQVSKPVSEVKTAIVDQDYRGIKASPRARKAAKKFGVDLNSLAGNGIRGMVVLQDVLDIEANKKTIKATPLARKIAAEQGLNLANIQGSGPRGMVNRSDVEGILQSTLTSPPVANQTPLTELRSIISSRLSQSWMERPQVTLTTEADATLFVTAREQINQELKKKNVKLSFNTLLIKLTAKALAEHAYMNVSLLSDGLVQHPHVKYGVGSGYGTRVNGSRFERCCFKKF